MSLLFELRRTERANKGGKDRERRLLRICLAYMPEERLNAMTYIKVVAWIESTWREFAKDNNLKPDAFKKLIKSEYKDVASILKW